MFLFFILAVADCVFAEYSQKYGPFRSSLILAGEEGSRIAATGEGDGVIFAFALRNGILC
jgi:hypothetical protein